MKAKEKEFLENFDDKNKSIDATEWIPSVLLHRKATEEDIAILEKKLGVSLPTDFRRVILDHQGDRPIFSTFAYQILETDEWIQTKMGPLYHCLDDADPNIQDYHILAYPSNIKCNKTDYLAFSETTEGNVICIKPSCGVVIVLDVKRGVGLAGENFTDFLWRMRLENYNILQEQQAEEADSMQYCTVCDEPIPADESYWTCDQCEDDQICNDCQKKGSHDASHILKQTSDADTTTLLLNKITPYRFQTETSPEEEEERKKVNMARPNGPRLLFLRWDDDKYEIFPELLKTDRHLNLLKRLEYYSKAGLMTPSHSFMQHILTGRHSVWYPQESSYGEFAYSIGFDYLFNKPEILLISDDKSMGRYRLALTINYVCNYANLISPITEGMTFEALVESCNDTNEQPKIDYGQYSHCKFTKLTDEERKEYMGFCSWFHVNFMDTFTYPCLVCRLNKKS